MYSRPMRGAALGLIAGATLLAADLASAQEEKFITIGTGGVTGVYYPTGGAICRLVNKGRQEHGIRCSVESTGGSVYNVNTIRQGELDMGVVQSDVQFKSLKGEGEEFESQGPFEDLRAVFSVHAEPFTVVARADCRHRELRRPQGQAGQHRQPGLRPALHDGGADGGQGLDDGRLRARLRAQVGRAGPGAVRQQDRRDGVHGRPPLGLDPGGDHHLRDQADPGHRRRGRPAGRGQPLLRQGGDPGRHVRRHDEDVETFGVKATFVSSAEVPDDVVYPVTKAVFENFEDFKKLHPAFATLEQKDMVTQALSAPLHAGAEKYYQEAGMM